MRKAARPSFKDHRHRPTAASQEYPLKPEQTNRHRFSRTNQKQKASGMNRSKYESQIDTPELDPHPADNSEKRPEDWVSANTPMTGAQTSYLKTLSKQTGQPDPFDERLSKAEASKRIDALKGGFQE